MRKRIRKGGLICEFYRRRDLRWSWRIYGENREEFIIPGRGFFSKSNAVRSAREAIAAIRECQIVEATKKG